LSSLWSLLIQKLRLSEVTSRQRSCTYLLWDRYRIPCGTRSLAPICGMRMVVICHLNLPFIDASLLGSCGFAFRYRIGLSVKTARKIYKYSFFIFSSLCFPSSFLHFLRCAINPKLFIIGPQIGKDHTFSVLFRCNRLLQYFASPASCCPFEWSLHVLHLLIQLLWILDSDATVALSVGRVFSFKETNSVTLSWVYLCTFLGAVIIFHVQLVCLSITPVVRCKRIDSLLHFTLILHCTCVRVHFLQSQRGDIRLFIEKLERLILGVNRAPTNRRFSNYRPELLSEQRVECDVILSAIGRVVDPDVNVSLAFLVVHSRKTNLSKDDCSVGRRGTAHQDQVFLDGKLV